SRSSPPAHGRLKSLKAPARETEREPVAAAVAHALLRAEAALRAGGGERDAADEERPAGAHHVRVGISVAHQEPPAQAPLVLLGPRRALARAVLDEEGAMDGLHHAASRSPVAAA